MRKVYEQNISRLMSAIYFGGVSTMKKQLTEINITKENGELLASVNFDAMNVINADDVIVRFNYGAPKNFVDVEGKVYISEDEEK